MNIYERDKMPVTASVFFFGFACVCVRVCCRGPEDFFFCVCVGVCVAKRTPPACEILMPAVFFYTSSCSWSCGRDRCRRRRGRRPRCVHFSLAPRPRRVYRVCKYVKHYSPPPQTPWGRPAYKLRRSAGGLINVVRVLLLCCCCTHL